MGLSNSFHLDLKIQLSRVNKLPDHLGGAWTVRLRSPLGQEEPGGQMKQTLSVDSSCQGDTNRVTLNVRSTSASLTMARFSVS